MRPQGSDLDTLQADMEVDVPALMLCLESGPVSVSLTRPICPDLHPGKTCVCTFTTYCYLFSFIWSLYVSESSLDMRKGGSSHLSEK